jgi:hypothetical protein
MDAMTYKDVLYPFSIQKVIQKTKLGKGTTPTAGMMGVVGWSAQGDRSEARH